MPDLSQDKPPIEGAMAKQKLISPVDMQQVLKGGAVKLPLFLASQGHYHPTPKKSRISHSC